MQWVLFQNKFELIGFTEYPTRAKIRNDAWLFVIHWIKAIVPAIVVRGRPLHFHPELKQFCSPVFAGTGVYEFIRH